MTTARLRSFEGVESVKFTTGKIPNPLPPLENIGRMTVTNAIHAVLAHAGRPLTVFEIAAELRKHGCDVKLGQYELFSTIYRYIMGSLEAYDFQKV